MEKLIPAANLFKKKQNKTKKTPPSPEPVAYDETDVTMEPIPQPPPLAPHHQAHGVALTHPNYEDLCNTSEEEMRKLLRGYGPWGFDYDEFCRLEPYERMGMIHSMRDRGKFVGVKRLRSYK